MKKIGRPKGSGMVPLGVRFWRYVAAGNADECWEWKGTTSNGYGRILKGGRGSGAIAAHRVSWELHRGPVASGLVVCHRCDNRRCVNPDHLFVGTQSENILDCVAKGRHPRTARPECTARGERHGSAKLTEAQVQEIRHTIANQGDAARKELAKKFGVHISTINSAASGKSWAHTKEISA